MSELAAAAERRGKHQEARVAPESPYYDPNAKEPWPYSRQLDKDAAELADAYLALVRPDDATPYSGDAWLESPGLAIGITKDSRGRWWAEAHQDGQRIVLCEIKTVGQLRSLASVLGIPLGERDG